MVKYQFVQTQSGLLRFLDEIENATWIAYDTEFISEGRYVADLCLVQVATEYGYYLLDPLKIRDLSSFWERLCQEDTTSIAHSCRSELEFCYRAIGKFPSRVFDVQLAAAFVGFEYPLNFKSLTQQTINVQIDKSETRTDWSRRPLLTSQLEYALNDVCYLKQIADYLTTRLEEQERIPWFLEETRLFCESLLSSFDQEHWRRILGSKKYSRDELAIIRELWTWRHEKALAKNIAPARIFRDDMILEVAKHKTADPQRIAVIRGIKGTADSYLVRELCESIERALKLPEAKKPKMKTHDSYPQYSLATQLMNVLIGQYCKEYGVSARLATTVADIRQAIAFYAGTLPSSEHCKLFDGWRGELLGTYIEDFLSGKYAMKFSDKLEDHPLTFFKNK
ncbi:MAG: HRDC domain-containing protein [Thermoguttaceae bacterium]|nr:HRDC domain-containing protein [Thermoguttaceae bacterium]